MFHFLLREERVGDLMSKRENLVDMMMRVCERVSLVWLVGWFLNVIVNNKAISQMGPKTERLAILNAATHETELGDHDFCLSRSRYYYTDTDLTSRERAATAGIELGTSSPGVSRSTD